MYPTVPLAQILSRSQIPAVICPEKTYKQVTVHLFHKGIVLRGEQSGSAIATARQWRVRTGQVLLSRIDARNGAIGLVPAELNGAIVTSDFWAFDVDSNLAEPRFLDLYFGTREFVEACQRASEGTTNRVRLQPQRFLEIQVPLPRLAEQRRIVARIEELSAKIEEARALRREAAEETTVLMKAAMRYIFAGGTFKEATLAGVCAAIIDNLHSNPIYAHEGVPCVRSPDIGWGCLELDRALRTSEEEYIRRTVRGEPQKDDIVLVREGGGTGKAAIVETGQRFSLGQRVMMLRPNKMQVLAKFLLYQVLSPAIYEEQVLGLIKGSASPHLNIGAIRTFRFILPPLLEQRRIVAYLDGLQAKIDDLKKLQEDTAAELTGLLPSILSRAFSGEL